MKNIAVLLAAGSGSRFGGNTPKQFLNVKGKLLIEYAMEAFQRHPMIDEIVVVTNELFIPKMEKLITEKKYDKFSQVLQGGAERYLSTLAAITAFKDEPEANLIFHDAARPFISEAIISATIESLKKHEAVVVAIPATDTILKIGEESSIVGIPEREELYNAQTPQAFRLSVIEEAFEKALQDPNFKATDDGSVVFRYLPKQKVKIVKGEHRNIKITFEEDLRLF